MKKRTTSVDVIIQAQTFKAGGCHSWVLINKGNTNCTVGGTLVLEPGESLSSPEEHVDVVDDTELDVIFDQTNAPLGKVIDVGANPEPFEYIKGVDPVPAKGNKLVVLRSMIQ